MTHWQNVFEWRWLVDSQVSLANCFLHCTVRFANYIMINISLKLVIIQVIGALYVVLRLIIIHFHNPITNQFTVTDLDSGRP